MNHFHIRWVAICAVALTPCAFAQTTGMPSETPPSNPATSTTTSTTTTTTDTQTGNTTDRALAQKIREDMMADATLSSYAHNVKVVSVDGRVTLNGTVSSEAEKTAVENAAARIAGKQHVVNALKVSPPK